MKIKLFAFTSLLLILSYLSNKFKIISCLNFIFLIIFTIINFKYLISIFKHKNSIKNKFYWLLLYIALSSIFILIYNLLIIEITGIKFQKFNLVFSISNFLLILLVPVLEELIFRGYFINKFLEISNKSFTVLIISFCFSVAHFFTNTGLLFAFIFSVIISLFYIRTGSLLFAIFLHIYCNLFTLFILPIIFR